MGTIWPAVTSCRAVIQRRRACSKAAGWSRTKTALKVSWDGMPWVRSRKRLSHCRFAWPKAAIWVKCLTPQITAHRPMTRMLVSGCKRVRARRGSSRSAKWSAKAASGVEGTGRPSVGSNFVGRHPRNYTNEPSAWNSQLAYFDAMRLPLLPARRPSFGGKNPEVTLEQVCQALNQQCTAWLDELRGTSRLEYTSEVIRYHQRRN